MPPGNPRSARAAINYVTDVLIVDSGGAGLRAASALHDGGGRALVLGKRTKTDAHTVLAEGGINAALGTLGHP
jgi:succinate dehydrogenase / fumarate reductase flavoprotein subunit